MNVEGVMEALGLDFARVIAKASATEDYARILTRRADDAAGSPGDDGLRLRAASAQTIAGSLWMLARPAAASGPLSEAERIHLSVGSAYGSMLSICAHPRRPEPAQPVVSDDWIPHEPDVPVDSEPEESFEPSQAFSRQQPAASLLAHLWPLAAGQTDADLHVLMSDDPLLQALPGTWLTGRLRIPLSHYRGLATEVDRIRHPQSEDRGTRKAPLSATRAFLARATETIGAAREDKYHWRTLRSPVLPAEPEVIAACVLVELTARDALGVSAMDAMGGPVSSLQGALLGVAQNLVDTGADAAPAPAT